MSKNIRETVNAKASSRSWSEYIKSIQSSIIVGSNKGLEYSKFTFMILRHVGWFIVTTGMITLLPLVLEVKREGEVEKLEQLQIQSRLAEGISPQELANNGLTSALPPKVLS
uniref:Uncharacterized protein n=1 Tax=Chromulina nebulosa TaxID=96789 RepID=A0A7S0SSA7_9STRA|mmetsp:Transcript_2807/g.2470  ORF Transcript_2807/g.2470 Transcript_2807/m.2470 type:complete len:112 (+) Transcript_2807:11-346(+)